VALSSAPFSGYGWLKPWVSLPSGSFRRILSPNELRWLSGRLYISLSASRVFDKHPVPLVFLSKRLDSTLWHHPFLRWVVSSTAQRPSASLWSESQLKVQHSLVHGITGGSAIVCLFGLTQAWDGYAVPTHAHSLPRDVYSVVSDHLIEGRPAPHPNVTAFENPRVHVICCRLIPFRTLTNPVSR
jgi:hypothetical protein